MCYFPRVIERNSDLSLVESGAVPDHVTFLNQVTYSGNLVQTE